MLVSVFGICNLVFSWHASLLSTGDSLPHQPLENGICAAARIRDGFLGLVLIDSVEIAYVGYQCGKLLGWSSANSIIWHFTGQTWQGMVAAAAPGMWEPRMPCEGTVYPIWLQTLFSNVNALCLGCPKSPWFSSAFSLLPLPPSPKEFEIPIPGEWTLCSRFTTKCGLGGRVGDRQSRV